MKKRLLPFILVLLLAISSFGVQAFAADTHCLDGNSETVSCIEDTNTLGSGKIIFYPKELETNDASYPVIVWANGTGCVTQLYYDLLRAFAGAGYIVVADTTVMSADGKAQIDSVDYIIEKNSSAESVFFDRVDEGSIGAAGHSQGGRSAVNAAAADSRIKCVLSIAGSSYKSEAEKLSAPVFFMTGTADMMVLSSMWVKPAYEAVQGRAVYASLKGGIHTTCIVSSGKVSGYGVDWFDAYLKGDSRAMAAFVEGGALACDSAWKNFACK